jgi:hypothetical protein
MNPQAHNAVNAARHVQSWGIFAARRYCERRGVHPRLFILARQLEAVAGFDNITGA